MDVSSPDSDNSIRLKRGSITLHGASDSPKIVPVVEEISKANFTRQVIWKIEFSPSDKHEILMRHSTLGGRRKVFVDGYLVFSERNFFDNGSTHVFNNSGHDFELVISLDGVDFLYDLRVDGVKILHESSEFVRGRGPSESVDYFSPKAEQITNGFAYRKEV